MEIWERRADETLKAWEAFKAYRDLGADRSYTAVIRVLGKNKGSLRRTQRWGQKYDWIERCRAYDLYLDRIMRHDQEILKRNVYMAKIQAYRDEIEEAATRVMSMAQSTMALVEHDFTVRMQRIEQADEPPATLEIAELCNLMRVCITALDVSSKIRGESLGVDQLVEALIEGRNQRN